MEQNEEARPSAQAVPDRAATPRWRLALLLVSSACLSGIAVVLWNRRDLSQLRRQPEMPLTSAEPEEFI